MVTAPSVMFDIASGQKGISIRTTVLEATAPGDVAKGTRSLRLAWFFLTGIAPSDRSGITPIGTKKG